jgi:hypothetical protein
VFEAIRYPKKEYQEEVISYPVRRLELPKSMKIELTLERFKQKYSKNTVISIANIRTIISNGNFTIVPNEVYNYFSNLGWEVKSEIGFAGIYTNGVNFTSTEIVGNTIFVADVDLTINFSLIDAGKNALISSLVFYNPHIHIYRKK